MATRIYDRELECGCMFSSDGGGAHIPCYADYSREEDRADAVKLCIKSYQKWIKTEDYQTYLDECEEKN